MENSLVVYCEHGAMTPTIRGLARDGLIELVHFPYDPDSRSRHVSRLAAPSEAQIRDLHIPIDELPGRIDDYRGSPYLEQILRIIGRDNRRDALHLDSASKSGCIAFITADTDILLRRDELGALLGLRILHPDEIHGLASFHPPDPLGPNVEQAPSPE